MENWRRSFSYSGSLPPPPLSLSLCDLSDVCRLLLRDVHTRSLARSLCASIDAIAWPPAHPPSASPVHLDLRHRNHSTVGNWRMRNSVYHTQRSRQVLRATVHLQQLILPFPQSPNSLASCFRFIYFSLSAHGAKMRRRSALHSVKQ